MSHFGSLNKRLTGATAYLLILLGLALFVLGPLFPALASEGRAAPAMLQDTATVSLDPSDPEIDVDATVDVDVVVEDVTDLFYVDLYVSFDPDVLEVVDADSGTDGVQIEPGTFLGTAATVETNEVDQESGDIAFSQEVSAGAVSGDGVLATISFRGKTPGTSDITIDDDLIYLEDDVGETITATVESGTITVTGDVTPTATVEGEETPSPVATVLPTFTPKPATAEPAGATPAPTSRPTSTPGPTASFEARTMQIWPDRRVGVSSDRLGSAASYVDSQILPFGRFDLSGGEFVEARTYLHFPIDSFPLGTDVKQATLHVYVDSRSEGDVAEFGVYRVLEPWSETGWNNAPGSWPALLHSPVAITEVAPDVEAALPESRATLKLARMVSDSPLPTPGPSLLPTPSLTHTPTPQMTAEVTQTPTPKPASTSTPTEAPDVTPSATTLTMGKATGQWIVWDVTALVRGWVLEEVDDYGLALAIAPEPGADPDVVGSLILARLLTADDVNTAPYIIADVEIHPVTPTPMPTPIPILPPAGSRSPAGWGGIGVSLVGVGLLMAGLGLALRPKIKG